MRFIGTILALLLASAPLAAANSGPGAIVEASAERVLAALGERRDEFKADPAKLEAFVRSELDATFDHDYSARLVLGRHGRGVDAARVEAFARALTDNLLRRYGKAMLEFDPRVDVRVLSETPLRDGALMRVATVIDRNSGSGVPVDYMFRRVGSEWKVFDVIVEGVSYVQTYRAQFDEQLRTQSLDQVIAGLRSGAVVLDG